MWKRLYLRPPAASRSAVGVAHGPPKALDAREADVVEQHDQDVRRAGGRPQRLDRRERRRRILRVEDGRARLVAIRDGQDRAVACVGHSGASSGFGSRARGAPAVTGAPTESTCPRCVTTALGGTRAVVVAMWPGCGFPAPAGLLGRMADDRGLHGSILPSPAARDERPVPPFTRVNRAAVRLRSGDVRGGQAHPVGRRRRDVRVRQRQRLRRRGRLGRLLGLLADRAHRAGEHDPRPALAEAREERDDDVERQRQLGLLDRDERRLDEEVDGDPRDRSDQRPVGADEHHLPARELVVDREAAAAAHAHEHARRSRRRRRRPQRRRTPGSRASRRRSC